MFVCVCVVVHMLRHTWGGQRTTTGYSFIRIWCVVFRSIQDIRLGGNCLFPLSHKDYSVTCFGTFHHSIEDGIGHRESCCLPLVQFFPSVHTSGIYNTISLALFSFFPLEHEHGEVRDLARYYLLSYPHCLGQSKCAVSIFWAAGRGNNMHLGINKITNLTYFHLN